MTRLDLDLPAFWESLSLLSRVRLKLKMPTCSFVTDIDTSSAHLVDQTLVIPGGGLTIETTNFQEAYTSTTPPALQLISLKRHLNITLLPNEPEACRKFHFFSKALSKNEMPDEFEIEPICEPGLCPCCIDSAQMRIRQIPQNPLTVILANCAAHQTSLIVSAKNADGGLTISHSPTNLLRQEEFLISEGDHDHIKINIRHLHALRLTEETLDGCLHQSLELINSHGEVTCTFSAPKKIISNSWETVLSKYNHSFQQITPA